MTSRLMLSAYAGVLIGALFAVSPALAQEGYSEWDTDGDGAISQEEWSTGFGEAGVYDGWDANDDGVLDEDEFNEGVFSAYDANDDDMIDEQEFSEWEEEEQGFWDI